MAKLVDVLAALCRKSFGAVAMRSAATGAVLTIRELYEIEEAAAAMKAADEGVHGSRMDPQGLLVVTRNGEPMFTEVL